VQVGRYRAGVNAEVPLWATLLIGLGAGALGAVGAVITGLVAAAANLGTALVQARTARQGAAATDATQRSISDRDLIKQALELQRSDDPRAQVQGATMLRALASMEGLDPKDALLVQEVTRPQIEPTLSAARALEGTAVPVEFYVEDDETEEA